MTLFQESSQRSEVVLVKKKSKLTCRAVLGFETVSNTRKSSMSESEE
jgi:hypothetical protein